jgi:hypothetical protein
MGDAGERDGVRECWSNGEESEVQRGMRDASSQAGEAGQ